MRLRQRDRDAWLALAVAYALLLGALTVAILYALILLVGAVTILRWVMGEVS